MSGTSKMGRPTVDTQALTLRLPTSMLEQLDEIRRTHKDLPNRQELIREILDAYISAHLPK